MRNHIKLLKNNIETQHSNSAKRNSILELCCEYSDLFDLEGDYLTCTDIVTRKINISRCVRPIYICPYRLPWAYRNEIETQITDTKRNSVSPFNFPLVVVKKKHNPESCLEMDLSDYRTEPFN